MLNQNYLKYISKEKHEIIHESLLRDIYYFYHGGIKPQKVLQINGNKNDLTKENLKIDIIL